MRINIFSYANYKIGDEVRMGNLRTGKKMVGRVVGYCWENPRYQNITLCGGRVVNSAENYYEVEIEEGDESHKNL